MGMEIDALVLEDPECSLVGAVECQGHPMIGNVTGHVQEKAAQPFRSQTPL